MAKPIYPTAADRMYKLVFFVPPSHLEVVKAAVFAAGAGHMGNYDQCCWQTLGKGQFRPLPGSAPFTGQEGELCELDEYRVELVCTDDNISKAVAALRQAHPYEEPAFDIWRLLDLKALSAE